MTNYTEINELLSQSVRTKQDRILNDTLSAPDFSMLKLRDMLEKVGKLHLEIPEKHAYIATIRGGFAKLHYATVAIQLDGDHLVIAIYADEGIIKQHTNEDVLNELRKAIRE